MLKEEIEEGKQRSFKDNNGVLQQDKEVEEKRRVGLDGGGGGNEQKEETGIGGLGVEIGKTMLIRRRVRWKC